MRKTIAFNAGAAFPSPAESAARKPPSPGGHLPILPPNHRRWQAPARGPAAVCTLHRPNRTETQNTHPLLVGWVFVRSEPTALAAGTAGTARGPAAVCALHRPTRNAKKRPCPLLVGHGRVDPEPTALAAGTTG